MVYYNDNEPFVCEWLNNLIDNNYLPQGYVDPRSITEIAGGDCKPTSHFFAGIGGWPLALSMVGWPEEFPVWTGSCPCQPFSGIGSRNGTNDERHLWPEFFRLIRECNPPVIFGEQVAGNAGLKWITGVFSDLESIGYSCASAVLCAASINLPHERERLFWVAHTKRTPRLRTIMRSNERPRYRVITCSGDNRKRRISKEPIIQPLAYAIPRSVGPDVSELGRVAFGPRTARQLISKAKNNRDGRFLGYGNSIVPGLAEIFIRTSVQAIHDTYERNK